MSSVSAIRHARKTWLSFVVFAQVIAGLAALVGIATSPLIGLVTAAALVLAFAVVRSLTAASRTIDTIFDEELDSPVQRHTDVR
jgi:4-hydroxybenzoate polyprenyltransferase